MTTLSASVEPFILSDGTIDVVGGKSPFMGRAVLPLLVGLMAPLLLAVLIEPGIVKNLRLLLSAVLVPLLFIVIGIYAYSVLVPGEVCGLVVEPDQRKICVIEANAFATRTDDVAFDDITVARVVTTYDRNGYVSQRGELVLSSGKHVLLPEAAGECHVAAINAAIGRA